MSVQTREEMKDDKDLGASADADRVTDERSQSALSPPSGSVPTGAVLALASEIASVRFPHGANADDLADIVREAIGLLCGAPITVESALRRFIAWADRVQDGEAGCNYLNAEKPPHGNGDDAWADLDQITDEARAAISRATGKV
jgi:hypothetical protein